MFLFAKNMLSIFRCKCGLVYSGWQPKQRLLDKFYIESQAMSEWAGIKQSAHEIEKQKEKYKAAVSLLKDKKVSSLIDIGCGVGRFLYHLRQALPEARLLGVDQNEAALNVARAYDIPVMNGGLYDQNWLNFEAATLWGVLEHVKDPVGALKNIKKKLVGQKIILVCVPNVRSMVVKTLREKCFTFCPQHLWYFDIYSLKHIFAQAGFSLDLHYTIERETEPILNYWNLLEPYQKMKPEWFKNHTVDEGNANLLTTGAGYKIVAYGKLL